MSFDLMDALALSTFFAVRDYYEDKRRLEEYKRSNYAKCYDEIGDAAYNWNKEVTGVLERSRQFHLEEEIVEGSKEFPLYIFLRVLMAQPKSISKYQLEMVNLYFNTIPVNISKNEYFQAVQNDNPLRKSLDEKYMVTTNTCGSFWETLIKLINMDDEKEHLEGIVDSYLRLITCFAILGECERRYTERIVENFLDGLQFQIAVMDNYNDLDETDNEGEVILSNLNNDIQKLRINCEEIANVGNEDDSIVVDFLDYFLVSIVIGIIEKAGIFGPEREAVLQYILDVLDIECSETAEDIYYGCETDAGMRNVFYNFANEWEKENFWKIHLIAAVNVNKTNNAFTFAEVASSFAVNIAALIDYCFEGYNAQEATKTYFADVCERMSDFTSNR